MPDYEIKKWDGNNFDINQVSYVAEAVAMKKWAFACDYIRVYALYTEGGIYLDSDVYLRKSLDFCRVNKAFTAVECFPDLMEKIYSSGQADGNGIRRSDVEYIDGIQIQAARLRCGKGASFYERVHGILSRKALYHARRRVE